MIIPLASKSSWSGTRSPGPLSTVSGLPWTGDSLSLHQGSSIAFAFTVCLPDSTSSSSQVQNCDRPLCSSQQNIRRITAQAHQKSTMGVSEHYGRRLIPQIVDDRAQSEPHRPVYSVPRDPTDLSKGFRDISALTFANAVNRVAWWLVAELGRSETFETVGYIGPRECALHPKIRESLEHG